MPSNRERHLLNAMQSLVLYAGGAASKAVKSLKGVAYQGRPIRKHKPSQYKKTPDGGAIFRMVSAKNPVTDYGRTKTMMAG